MMCQFRNKSYYLVNQGCPCSSVRWLEHSTACMLLQIVVHGLPWSVEWQDLKDLSKQYGDVVKADIAKRSDGKSRGFGTVVFKTPEDAQNAIQVHSLCCSRCHFSSSGYVGL